MALTDQPYMPLFVDDWMNNNKLKMCTPSAHGLMISIMCVMHKEKNYGKVLLRQKFNQSDNQIQNFALQLSKLCAFDVAEIIDPLSELLEEEVLTIADNELVCPRMIKDGEISSKRSKAGRSGGKTTQSKKSFDKANDETIAKANSEANPVNGIVIENVIVNENKSVKEKESLREKTKNLELIFPFDDEVFRAQWQHWKIYKRKEFKFNYKSIQSEQAGVNKLHSLSGGNQKKAIAIIHQSMENGWKGFFELKKSINAKQDNQNSEGASDEFRAKTAKRLGLV